MTEKLLLFMLGVALSTSACSSGSGSSDDDTTPDVVDDTGGDVAADVTEDTGTDATPDAADTDDDAAPDVDEDTTEDVASDPADADVEPDPDWEALFDPDVAWVPPSADWSTCDEVTNTRATLAEKAAYYDWIVPAVHQFPTDVPGHEDYSRVYHISCDGDLPTDIVADGQLPTCTFNYSENNGLWTSLYVASQAFRYAVTGEQEALDQLRRTLRGTYNMMRITGVPGLFTRDFHDPSTDQQGCPSDPMDYRIPGSDRVGNNWVMVGDDGCFETYDPDLNDGAGDWVSHPESCTDTEFAGFCWQMNMSKDEMSGHMFAAGIIARIVDDEEVRNMAIEILSAVGHHLVDNDFWITDWHGDQTRYGSAHALSLDHVPGFNAMLALSWLRTAATATGDEELIAEYHDCLLQADGTNRCIDRGAEQPRDYRQHLGNMALELGCQTNYDNVGIMSLAYPNLMWWEPDPENVALFRDIFHENSRGPDGDGRELWNQGNAHLNFVIASMMGDDPAYTADAEQLVHDGVCALREFRATNIRQAVDGSMTESVCTSMRHGNLAAEPLPLDQRCVSVFEWWGDPAQIESCPDEPTRATPPADFLLPYWMGRYFGFIGADD